MQAIALGLPVKSGVGSLPPAAILRVAAAIQSALAEGLWFQNMLSTNRVPA
jgi:hypothetical protein